MILLLLNQPANHHILQVIGPAIDTAAAHQSKNKRKMPSAASLRQPPEPASSSHSAPLLTHSLSSGSRGFRPSPYPSETQCQVVNQRSSADVRRDLQASGRTQRPDLDEDEKAIIAAAGDLFIATACITHAWEPHCDARTARCREAMVVVNRTTLEKGGTVAVINGRSRGLVSDHFTL